MPSWYVHNAVAEDVFGISRAIADKVNKIIDGEDIHDLGRRMPNKPRLIELLLSPEMASIRATRRKLASIRIQNLLSSGIAWSNAFWLHHALDILSPRLIAVNITGVNLSEYKENIITAVCSELSSFTYKLGLEDFLSRFKSQFDSIVNHPDLINWIENATKHRRAEDAVNIQDYLFLYIRRILQRRKRKARSSTTTTDKKAKAGSIFKIDFSGNQQSYIEAISTALRGLYDEKREYMRLMYIVSLYAAKRSHLLDYALLTPYPWEVINETVLRVTKRRAAGIGRCALRACEDLKDDAERRTIIVGEVRRFERVWLLRYKIRIPQECIERYADSFIAGYKIVTSFIKNLN